MVGAFWALGLQHHLPVALFNEQYLGLFLGLGLAGVFIVVKAHPAAPHDRVPWYDWTAAAAGLGVGLYIAVLYPAMSYSLASLTWDRLVPAAVAIVLVLEATRRIAGWALMWIALACILYAKFGWLLPGLLYAKGSSWGRIAVYLYLDSSGILGIPLGVTASIVVAYIFFGQALTAVRGDAFLTGFAMALMGRYRGGSAKMAVVSSSLYGTVSGSAVANVVVDGAVTIPMMKRSGYPPHLAAAIEAVSSNGGQIMPPVMGAAAFLIAEYLSIPYGQVALAAALPAAPLLPGPVRPDRSRSGQARAHRSAARRAAEAARRHARRLGVPRPARRAALHAHDRQLGGREGGHARGRRDLARGLPAEGDASELARCHGRRRGHRADDAGPHRHHDAGRHRHRRVSALRADVEAADRAHERRGRQRLSSCSSSPRSSPSCSACRCPPRWSTSPWRC